MKPTARPPESGRTPSRRERAQREGAQMISLHGRPKVGEFPPGGNARGAKEHP